MSQDACILTTKDLTILEVMLDRCLGRDDPMAPLLRRKINSAQVVFSDDIPPTVATLNSRVLFSVDGRDPDTRVLSHDPMNSAVGFFLPITSSRGLALIGLSEGQAFQLPGQTGVEERVMMEKVLYQPEAARREKELMECISPPAQGRPTLRLVRGASYSQPHVVPATQIDFDDPGPSAA